MTYTPEKLTSDLHSLSRSYSPSDSAPNLAAQAQGRLQRQRAKRAGGALVAALAVGALALGGSHVLSELNSDSKVVVNAAGQGNVESQPAHKPASEPVAIGHEKEHTLTSDIVPQQNINEPVVTVNQQNPADTMNVLADRLAKTEGAALQEGHHLVATTISPSDGNPESASVRQNWYSPKGELFSTNFLDSSQLPLSTEKVPLKDKTIRWNLIAPSPNDYTNERYVTANGDGDTLLTKFRADTKPERPDLVRVMFKEFGYDSSMPMTGLQKAGMLRALAKAGPLSMTEVTKDHFGRDVITVWSTKDEHRTGLILSAHNGEIFGSTLGTGENHTVEYQFAEYVKAAK